MSAQPTELQARLLDLFGNPNTADPTKLYGNLTVNPTGVVSIGTGLTMPDGFTSSISPSGRNRIINGDCRIAQYATATVTTTAGTIVSSYGGPDRFTCQNSAGGTVTQSAGTITYGGISRPAVVQTATTIMTDNSTTKYWSGITQIIEGSNCFDLLGAPATISFIFKASLSGTYSVALRDSSGTNSFVSSFTAVAGVAQKVTVLVPTIPIGVAVSNSNSAGFIINIGALNVASYQTSTLNSWQVANALVATGFTNWGLTAGATISVAELQFEAGSQATPFERRSVSTELMSCYRYYYQITCPVGQVQSLVAIGFINAATSVLYSLILPTTMRAAPTISSNNLWNTSAATQNQATALNIIGINLNNSVGFQVVSSGASYTVGQVGGLYLGGPTGSTGGSLVFNAEL